ncbi:MAG TPA: pyridoxal phosphate-dependent aminotransferase [Chloroflexota bacterium]|nr:pyridoxal phosphate-dependent aminotransferase [Chloroflexota bacterium]
MTDLVSPRIAGLQPSPTIAVGKAAQELRRQGVDVVDFGPGEPDFDTPWPVRTEAIRALEEGETHYAPSRGIPALRTAITGKLARENGLHYEPDEILVTPGAKQAVLEAVFATTMPGDEVILFDPSWGSYDAIARLAGAVPVHVPLRADFTIDPERVRAALTPRSRLMIVGTPNNPSGHVLTARELDILAGVAEERNLVLISDEIYERIAYPGVRVVSPASLPALRGRTVTINGFSKAYAMTGWRLGYAAAPLPLVEAMLKVHEHSVTTATTFVQLAGIEALNGSQEPIHAMVEEFTRRRGLIVEGLQALPGVSIVPPQGTFYAFPDVSGTGLTGTELAHHLLQAGVAVTPGAGFGEGWDTHIRLSFATSEERIREGLKRMAGVLQGETAGTI